MTDTQPTAEKSDTPRTDAAKAIVAQFASDECVELVGELIGQLERELTEAKRSMRREENARDILAKENTRLRDQVIELRVALNVATVNQS